MSGWASEMNYIMSLVLNVLNRSGAMTTAYVCSNVAPRADAPVRQVEDFISNGTIENRRALALAATRLYLTCIAQCPQPGSFPKRRLPWLGRDPAFGMA